ncbi:MAG: hypothetical protein J5744_07740 [Oscillospiraceae bacterium]|nr:hypothetical protein [Oscillospiraceae bacterium]
MTLRGEQVFLCLPEDEVSGRDEFVWRMLKSQMLEKIGEVMDPDRWYGVKFSTGEEQRSDRKVCFWRAEVEPAREKKVTFVTAEELHLTPTPSFKRKLKNVWAYLMDKHGGELEVRDV